VFWRERLMKLSQYLIQMKDSALENDEVIRTMLENQETLDFAD